MGRQLHRLQFHLDCTVQSDSLGPRSVVLCQSIFRAACAASAEALLAFGRSRRFEARCDELTCENPTTALGWSSVDCRAHPQGPQSSPRALVHQPLLWCLDHFGRGFVVHKRNTPLAAATPHGHPAQSARPRSFCPGSRSAGARKMNEVFMENQPVRLEATTRIEPV